MTEELVCVSSEIFTAVSFLQKCLEKNFSLIMQLHTHEGALLCPVSVLSLNCARLHT